MSLEAELHEDMLDIYKKAKKEAKYNAIRFLQMVVEFGGLETANKLINAENVSEGYTALWERGMLNLTVEALIYENEKYHSLFTKEQYEKCIKRLKDYGYPIQG